MKTLQAPACAMFPATFRFLSVIFTLFAVMALPFPVHATSHGTAPALSPGEPGAFDALEALGVGPAPSMENTGFLDPDAAFALTAAARDANTIVLRWDLADTYYLYRHRFGFSISPESLELDVPRLPPGTDKQDPYFGQSKVYYRQVEIVLPIKRRPRHATEARLKVSYQGCTDLGLCYPPVEKSLTLALPSME